MSSGVDRGGFMTKSRSRGYVAGCSQNIAESASTHHSDVCLGAGLVAVIDRGGFTWQLLTGSKVRLRGVPWGKIFE
jgi:glycosylphosphatidylinositol transamidase (GPIT) subunit GPI8